MKVVLLLLFTFSKAKEVCTTCDSIPSEQLSFCSSPPYQVCISNIFSVEDKDHLANSTYLTILKESNLILPGCLESMKLILCRSTFGACELGERVKFCKGGCSNELSRSNCPNDVLEKICSLTGISAEKGCFDLSYAGPKTTQWIAGVSIAVVFSFLASVGINLQKKAIKNNSVATSKHLPMTSTRPVYRLPLWLLGFFLIIMGSILDFVAFGLAPQSLLAPLAALTLVWNMILAPCFNDERLDRQDIAATFVIFTGASIAVVFASHSTPEYSLDDLLTLYKDTLTISYFCVICVLAGVHFCLIHAIQSFHLNSGRHRVIHVGQPMLWSRMHLVAYAGLAGLMGGQSVLFAKSCAELVKALIRGEDCLNRYETFLLILALVLCLIAQIHFLNGGLTHYDALSVVPIYQAYWIICGVLGGVIYFQEIRSYSLEQSCMFTLGILMTISGVALLSQRKHSSSTPETPTTTTDTVSSTPTMATLEEQENIISETNEINRHAIDNFLDMSPRILVSDLLGEFGINKDRQMGLFRRYSRQNSETGSPSQRSNSLSPTNQRLSKDEAVGEATSTLTSQKKRRSITFSGFTVTNKRQSM